MRIELALRIRTRKGYNYGQRDSVEFREDSERRATELQEPTFTNVASLTAAGVTAAKNPRRDHLPERRRDGQRAVPGDQ